MQDSKELKSNTMSMPGHKATALSLLLAFGLYVHAQHIIIDPELASRSEPLTVKMGSQGFGKIWKYKFGEYAVVDSKSGMHKTSYKSKLLSPETDITSTHNFSFTLCNNNSDSAFVNAAKNIEIRTIPGFELFEGLIIREGVLLSEKHNFTASITMNSDTTDTWYLILNTEYEAEELDTVIAVLLGKAGEIQIFPASSNKDNSDTRALPALGYELYENDRALAAVQYYGGGLWGTNKNIVWIRNDLDNRKKLFLAAAVTSLMQHQMENTLPND